MLTRTGFWDFLLFFIGFHLVVQDLEWIACIGVISCEIFRWGNIAIFPPNITWTPRLPGSHSWGGDWGMQKEWEKAGRRNMGNLAENVTVLRGCERMFFVEDGKMVHRVSCWSVRVRARLLERVEVELSCGHLTCWRPLCLELSSVAGVSLSQPPSHPLQSYVCLSAAAAVSSHICVWKAFSCFFSLSLSCKLRKDDHFKGFSVSEWS